MSEYTDKIKAGQCFIRKNKWKTEKKHPALRGHLRLPNGELYDIALWLQEKDGEKYYSGTVAEPYVKPEAEEDDIPF